MIDSKSLVHLPASVRTAAVTILLAVLFGSAAMTAYFVVVETPEKPQFTQWILISVALVQMALTGLGVALVLFFTEREVGTEALEKRTEHFLDVLLPSTLARVSPSYANRHAGCTVTRLGRSDIFGAAYELSTPDASMRLWVGLNVRRLIVIYWLDVDGPAAEFEARVKRAFQFTLAGSKRVGFQTFFEYVETSDAREVLSVWSTLQQSANLLLLPSERLFWMQDVAMMTESFWRTSMRSALRISNLEPGPL